MYELHAHLLDYNEEVGVHYEFDCELYYITQHIRLVDHGFLLMTSYIYDNWKYIIRRAASGFISLRLSRTVQ